MMYSVWTLVSPNPPPPPLFPFKGKGGGLKEVDKMFYGDLGEGGPGMGLKKGGFVE